MLYEEVKAGILNLDQNEQKRLIMEVLTEMLPRLCQDEVCLDRIRNFVDEETVRSYREQHMDSI